MPRGRVSKRSIDAFSCPNGKDREFLWDDALAGFGVAAFESGKKVYVVQFRKDGRSRRVTLGDHGRLTPEKARSAAKTMLGAVEQGADPAAARRAARAVRSFGEVADEFLRTHVQAKRKPKTYAEYDRLLTVHIRPAIGGRRISELSKADVARLHAKMGEAPYIANRTTALISSIWNWAARRDECAAADNPAQGLDRFPESSRERFLTRDELMRVGDALRVGERQGIEWAQDAGTENKHLPKPENRRTVLDPFAVAAIRLLMLTGARVGEILNARWSEVDVQRGIIHLPDSKTGAKPVYLSAAALQLLSDLPQIEGCPYLIAGRDGQPRSDLKRPWAAVCKAAGLERVRLHDLRHTFASYGAGASRGLPIIGKLLGHTQAATTHRYSHLDADPMRRAVETIGGTIAAAMGDRSGGEVVRLGNGGRK